VSGTVTSCVFLRFRKGVFSPSSRVVCVQLCVRPVSPAPVSGSHRGGYTAARHPPLLRLGWVCRDVREQNRKKESLFASLARALTNTLLSLSPPPCCTYRYQPQRSADGGILSNWQPMYEPSTVKADADRLAAFEADVPHGAGGEGAAASPAPVTSAAALAAKFGAQCPHASLLVVSELHRDEEYGGPFWIKVPTKTRVHELRGVIAERCGVLPGLLRLSYAGKKFEDPERNLEHYGVKYWNAKFPDWPVIIRRF